uniref:Uncharacterized protein n=1 Tax=Sphaerodactylus townsendi TaxID=933632 RepID=A0ACB8G7A8_9SAUR
MLVITPAWQISLECVLEKEEHDLGRILLDCRVELYVAELRRRLRLAWELLRVMLANILIRLIGWMAAVESAEIPHSARPRHFGANPESMMVDSTSQQNW